MNRDELQGVVAHELGHIKNRDVALMTTAGIMLGAIVLLADFGMRAMWFSGGSRRSRSDSGGGGEVRRS
jgi:heat shock protein HtpX